MDDTLTAKVPVNALVQCEKLLKVHRSDLILSPNPYAQSLMSVRRILDFPMNEWDCCDDNGEPPDLTFDGSP